MQHFQLLFGVNSIGGCLPKLNEVSQGLQNLAGLRPILLGSERSHSKGVCVLLDSRPHSLLARDEICWCLSGVPVFERDENIPEDLRRIVEHARDHL